MRRKSNQAKVTEFHSLIGHPVALQPNIPSCEVVDLRIRLIWEEFRELIEAFAVHDKFSVADALGDLMYVIYGTACACGIPLDNVFDEIHRSNLTKVGPDGKVQMRDDGKIIKPSTYQPPEIGKALYGSGRQKRGK